ncbi:MAG: DUF512 domain-containing protein [Clostridia bacterium]
MRILDKVLIYNVEKYSIADEIGLKRGEYILSINGEKIIDILDYKFNEADEYIELEIQHLDGLIEIYEIEKDAQDELGIVFESELIDAPHSCYNNCIFCFMGQLPPNVRDTLVFKDDDYRLSFFTGNYITLTNMKETDINRIIKYRLSPVNISVHATDEKVRAMMLNNKNAKVLMKYIEMLYNANIHMNTQIVLCKGINDGEILEKTLADLSKFCPCIQSICIVPVGVTKFRDGLYPLEAIGLKDSRDTIYTVTKYQKLFKQKYKTNLVYLADEFYYKAKIKIPKYSDYEDFPQLENGVGMTAIFDHDFEIEIKKLKKNIDKYSDINKTISIITGKITEEYMIDKMAQIQKLIPTIKINVFAITNHYFGEDIVVTGLVTGQDIISRIEIEKSKLDIGSYLIIPNVMLKEEQDIFLDDTLLVDVSDKLNINIVVSTGSAKSLLDAILLNVSKDKIYKLSDKKKAKNKYEQNSIKK